MIGGTRAGGARARIDGFLKALLGLDKAAGAVLRLAHGIECISGVRTKGKRLLESLEGGGVLPPIEG